MFFTTAMSLVVTGFGCRAGGGLNINVGPYSRNDANAWDDFSKNSLQATFLHSRRFLCITETGLLTSH